MKDQPLLSPDHGPPFTYRSGILWREGRPRILFLFESIMSEVPTSLVLIGMGILVYLLGFGRLVSTVLDEPQAIDQVVIPESPELGFAPYLVSSEPSPNGQSVPLIDEDMQEIVETVAGLHGELEFSLESVRRERLNSIDPSIPSAEFLTTSIWLPEVLIIPKIELEAPIDPVSYKLVEADGKTYEQWFAPDSRTVGWHQTSAALGRPGNTVLNGHHNIFGDVFRDLHTLEVGDLLIIQSGSRFFEYVVGRKEILPERYQTIDTRLENSRWIQPSDDERITLVTCWPYESNTHRVIVVAVPVKGGG
jgi:LPXTG-site transpeptidase (sortase) family protein